MNPSYHAADHFHTFDICRTSSNKGALVGGFVGAAIFVLATAIFGWCFIRRRRRRQETLNRSLAATQESLFTETFPSGLSSMVPSSAMMPPSKSISPASHSYMSRTSVSEVPMSMSGPFTPQARVISPSSMRKKPVPYIDVPISHSRSISFLAVTGLNPEEKTTDPFADPGPSSASGSLRNPFDDPVDVPKLAVPPASSAERRFSDASVTSVTSTGSPKQASIFFVFCIMRIDLELFKVWHRPLGSGLGDTFFPFEQCLGRPFLYVSLNTHVSLSLVQKLMTLLHLLEVSDNKNL